MKIDIDASELAILAGDLERTGPSARRRASLAVRRSAFELEARAKSSAPVDTGRLKNSITTQTRETAAGASALISAETNYACFVEYGTSRMAGQPFMGPAFDATVPGLEAAIAGIGSHLA